MNKPLPVAPRVCVEGLESRELFSLSVQFDYRYDTTGFFSSQARKDVLVAAAKSVTSRLADNFSAVSPGNGNTWTINLTAPASGAATSITDATIPANTIVVYVGARDLAGNTLGQGGPTGWGASGTTDWINLVRGRGQGGATATPRTDYAPKAGAIAFDSLASWYFGTGISGIGSTQNDFYSVAAHELGHVLGIGAGSETWPSYISGGKFNGPKTSALYGGGVPVTGDNGHFADGTYYKGQEASMDPTIKTGVRKAYTELDFAALDDIGYDVTAAPTTGTGTGTGTGKITGNLFNDNDADAVKDSGETNLAGWRVFVDKDKDGVYDSGETGTTTDASGNYTLTLSPGSYRIAAVANGGYRRTLPSAGYYDVTVASGGTAGGKNFAFSQKVLFGGAVFSDLDGDGVKDGGETGLSGWKVFIDKDKDGVWDSNESYVLTDSSGNWQFKAQTAGSFSVRVVQQSGYTLKGPSSKAYAFSLASGASKTGLNFAEKKA